MMPLCYFDEQASELEKLESRLAEVEGKLLGVYNLSGKLIALEGMMAEFGHNIPDLEYNPGDRKVPPIPMAAKEKPSSGGPLMVIGQSPRNMPSPRSTASVPSKETLSVKVKGQTTPLCVLCDFDPKGNHVQIITLSASSASLS
jgi:hypothetical protein